MFNIHVVPKNIYKLIKKVKIIFSTTLAPQHSQQGLWQAKHDKSSMSFKSYIEFQ